MNDGLITLYVTEVVDEVPAPRERKKHRFELMRKITNISAQEDQSELQRQQIAQQQYNPQAPNGGYYYPNANAYFQSIDSDGVYQQPYSQSNPRQQDPYIFPSYGDYAGYGQKPPNVVDIINNVNNDYMQNPPKRPRGRPRKNPSSINGNFIPGVETKAKLKESEDFYEVRFDDTVKALEDLADEIDDSIDESKSELEDIKKSRTKSQMALTSQRSNITNLFNTKLNVLKEVNATKKIVSDLEIKKHGKKDSSEETRQNEARLLDALFTKISGIGSAPIPTSLMMQNINQAQGYQSIPGMPIGPDNIPPYESYVDSQIDDRIRQLENSGEIAYNKNDASIRYESAQPEIVVVRAGKDEWRLEAVDANEHILHGYPLQSVQSLGKIKFTPDGMASDSYGNKYRVIDIT